MPGHASGGAGRSEERRAGAIIVAAGQSSRMEGIDKLFWPILGVPLLCHTIAAFEAAPSVENVVLVVTPVDLERGKALVCEHGFGKVREICPGGARRQDSVRKGLERLPACPWVVVHDGARPCVESDLIERGLDEALRWGSAIAAVPVKDTIKVVGQEGEVTETPDRDKLWAAQTPQIFPWEVLHQAHRQTDVTVTDDAALVERMGYHVHIYLGSHANIKVTTREDILVVETLLRTRKGPGGQGGPGN